MTSYKLLESPSKLFSNLGNLPTTLPKKSIQRQFILKSPERQRLNFDIANNISKDPFDYKFIDKTQRVFDLDSRMGTVLRNNKELTQENRQMKSLLLIQRNQIDQLRIIQSRTIDAAFTQELEAKNYEHRVQVQTLLSEITRLQDGLIHIQNQKNYEINNLRSQLDKLNIINMTTFKRSSEGITEAYELQIKKLGDLIQFKEDQIQKIIFAKRRQKELLSEELLQVKSELKHMLALKNNEISELKLGYQSELCKLQREYRQNEQNQAQAHDLVVKRMNRQLNQRLGDIERLSNQIKSSNSEQNQLFKQLNCQKMKFQSQLDAQMNDAKTNIRNQKQKMDMTIKKIIQNLNNANQNKIKILQDEVQLLKQLLENRRQQADKHKDVIKSEKDTHKLQIQNLQNQNQHLRQRIQQLTKDNISSIQALKIKIAQLHQSDIRGLADVYQARINSISEELAQKNKQIEEMRKRLHEQMQGKLHLRKQCQLQISKLKNNIMDLRIKMNAVQIQMKDNVVSMRSQLDVTSQGLINDRQTKQKTIKSYQDQMRKLRQTIQSRDDELKIVEQNAANKQQFYKNQAQVQSEKVKSLKKQLQERQKRKAKELQNKEDEINRLKKQVIELNNHLNQQHQSTRNKIKQLEEKKQAVSEKLNLAKKQIQTLKQRIGSLQHDINLARGDVQTVKFQQQAAANDEREKVQESINKTHHGFRQYYQKRIKQLQNDKSELQTINSTQSQQINQLVVKYKQLEDALKTMMDSQKRLTQLQTKIIHIGTDNNLLKNLAQIIKRPFH